MVGAFSGLYVSVRAPCDLRSLSTTNLHGLVGCQFRCANTTPVHLTLPATHAPSICVIERPVNTKYICNVLSHGGPTE